MPLRNIFITLAIIVLGCLVLGWLFGSITSAAYSYRKRIDPVGQYYLDILWWKQQGWDLLSNGLGGFFICVPMIFAFFFLFDSFNDLFNQNPLSPVFLGKMLILFFVSGFLMYSANSILESRE